MDGFLWEARWGYTDGGEKLCGDQNEKLYDVEFLVPHNSPTVTVVITSSLKENTGKAWGFRNFHIEYVACPNDCGICFANGECS